MGGDRNQKYPRPDFNSRGLTHRFLRTTEQWHTGCIIQHRPRDSRGAGVGRSGQSRSPGGIGIFQTVRPLREDVDQFMVALRDVAGLVTDTIVTGSRPSGRTTRRHGNHTWRLRFRLEKAAGRGSDRQTFTVFGSRKSKTLGKRIPNPAGVLRKPRPLKLCECGYHAPAIWC